MKREGRPHGMVRTYVMLPSPLNQRPNNRCLNKLDAPPTAGIFTKVPAKPTNHSKFTGKCRKSNCSQCHLHPVSKSKNKSRGTLRSKSRNADDYLLNTGGVASNESLDDDYEDSYYESEI